MKITICTSGRFWLADLARELILLGHDVTFHSIVPPWRLQKFGIPWSSHVCHLGAVLPWIVALRKLKLSKRLQDSLEHRIQRILDARFARIKNPGDVFIGLSSLCVEAMKAARLRGARVHLERGSQHILSQKEILDALLPDQPSSVPDWAVKRELAGYELADTIVVPSRHVLESFIELGVPQTKLFRNPYGVDLSGFPPSKLLKEPYDVIMVGAWSLRKGCDLLARVALDDLGLRLLHVGPISDATIPTHPNFQHFDPVPQSRLHEFYAQARIFVIPSHEEGLALVQAQALASGLPLVGSTRSGAEDLAELTGLGVPMIQSVVPDDPAALATAIRTALQWSKAQPVGPRNLLGDAGHRLSWAAYGSRYDRFLREMIHTQK